MRHPNKEADNALHHFARVVESCENTLHESTAFRMYHVVIKWGELNLDASDRFVFDVCANIIRNRIDIVRGTREHVRGN